MQDHREVCFVSNRKKVIFKGKVNNLRWYKVSGNGKFKILKQKGKNEKG